MVQFGTGYRAYGYRKQPSVYKENRHLPWPYQNRQGSRVEARSSVRGTSKRVEAGADADAPQEGVRLERNRNVVFTKDNREWLHPDSITRWLNNFSRDNGLPHINPHAFRHTVASVLLANGTDIVTVSKQLGHASVNTTESFYSHIIEENKAKASKCIADVLLRKKA
jgi:integrase